MEPIEFREHEGYRHRKYLPDSLKALLQAERVYQRKFDDGASEDNHCYRARFDQQAEHFHITTSYYIGVDWLSEEDDLSIYVSPKLNQLNNDDGATEVDYMSMLTSAMSLRESVSESHNLIKVDWDREPILINQKQDCLSPFLVVEFLSVLKSIVKKGLKKSYYQVENDLRSRVKGKVLVSKTIKRNIARSNSLVTTCQYEEFGVNCLENRVLNKALTFVRKYVAENAQMSRSAYVRSTIGFALPAFESVSDQISLSEIKKSKKNVFFREYDRGLRLAELILRRFGYNISNTTSRRIPTPPFWIDMTRLFELHVLEKLQRSFPKPHSVLYQEKIAGLYPDYLIKSEDGTRMVVDAKYKNYRDYQVNTDDVRQVAGYARMTGVYDRLGFKQEYRNESIECLIVYADVKSDNNELNVDELKNYPVDNYEGIYKIGIKLPTIHLIK